MRDLLYLTVDLRAQVHWHLTHDVYRRQVNALAANELVEHTNKVNQEKKIHVYSTIAAAHIVYHTVIYSS